MPKVDLGDHRGDIKSSGDWPIRLRSGQALNRPIL